MNIINLARRPLLFTVLTMPFVGQRRRQHACTASQKCRHNRAAIAPRYWAEAFLEKAQAGGNFPLMQHLCRMQTQLCRHLCASHTFFKAIAAIRAPPSRTVFA